MILERIFLEEERYAALHKQVKSALDVYFEFKESASIKTVNISDNSFTCTAMYRYSEDFIVVDYPDNSIGVFYAENLNLKS
jgi:hypothetical protein